MRSLVGTTYYFLLNQQREIGSGVAAAIRTYNLRTLRVRLSNGESNANPADMEGNSIKLDAMLKERLDVML